MHRVAELIGEVVVQRRGGRVGAGPNELLASISCIVRGKINWWECSHCMEYKSHNISWVECCVSPECYSKGDRMKVKLTVLQQTNRLAWGRWAGTRSLVLEEEEDGVFDANGKYVCFISAADSSVLSCICSIKWHAQLPARTWTQSYSLKGIVCIFFFFFCLFCLLHFLPVFFCFEPELQWCVFLLLPHALHMGLVVILAL